MVLDGTGITSFGFFCKRSTRDQRVNGFNLVTHPADSTKQSLPAITIDEIRLRTFCVSMIEAHGPSKRIPNTLSPDSELSDSMHEEATPELDGRPESPSLIPEADPSPPLLYY